MSESRLCSQFEVWEITQMKDDAIYDTVNTGKRIWIPVTCGILRQVGMELYITPSIPGLPEIRTDWVIPQ